MSKSKKMSNKTVTVIARDYGDPEINAVALAYKALDTLAWSEKVQNRAFRYLADKMGYLHFQGGSYEISL